MKTIYKIKGMHCRSCEVLIENEVRKIPGVKVAHASMKRGELLVASENDVAPAVMRAVRNAGYEIGENNLGLFNKSKKNHLELLQALLIIIVLAIIFRNVELGNILSPASFTSSSLAAIFTIGLTAGVSSCMALVGGLVLGIATRHAEKHPNASVFQKFRPHLFFNLGRVISFFLLGGVIGEIGSFFRISGPVLGLMIILVGVVMFVLGLQLTELFPKLTSLTLPKFLSGFQQRKDKEYSHKNALALGALTFFLPCGFTQAAQIYAISTGSFLRGALVMSLFALGTTPGLLGIGGLASAIKNGKYSGVIFKAIGILIILLSIYNLKNGLNLTGVSLKKETKIETSAPTIWGPPKPNEFSESVSDANVQIIKAVYNPSDEETQYVIEPKEFTVKVNKPVRFEVLAEKDGLGCMGSITLPGLVNKFEIFTKGETAIFEFTPQKVRSYQITCGMGIPMGKINVIN